MKDYGWALWFLGSDEMKLHDQQDQAAVISTLTSGQMVEHTQNVVQAAEYNDKLTNNSTGNSLHMRTTTLLHRNIVCVLHGSIQGKIAESAQYLT